MDLLIRAGREDHKVVQTLCAPATAGLWSPRALPLTGVVTDAAVAMERPMLRETAEVAGVPFLVDPLTPLLVDEQVPGKGWAGLPFAHPEKMSPADLGHHAVLDELIDQCVGFQREQGATVLIPPYLYLDKKDSPWVQINQDLLARTAAYLEHENISLPVAPVFAASLHQFGPQATWSKALDPYLRVAADMNIRHLGLSLSWTEPRAANLQAVAVLMTATQHAVSTGVPILPWRQGLYGAALTGVGTIGYETGPGHGEALHYPSYMATKRPKEKPKSGGGGDAYVYFTAFGRSISRKPATAVMSNGLLRSQLVCPVDTSCCPDGATSMTTDWRQHAVRARHRELQEMERMPASRSWRLNKIARDADVAAGHARAANDVLAEKKIDWRLPVDTFGHISAVADEIRSNLGRQAA